MAKRGDLAGRTGGSGTGRVPAPLLVLGSVVCIQSGQAFGKELFALVGVGGVVTFRLTFAALLLLVLRRPRLPDVRSSVLVGAPLGVAIAGMHLIYPAMARLPLGIASALQYVGPLVLALAGSRRAVDVGWALLAGLGVLLACGPGGHVPSVSGIAYALGSGACMAAYLLLNRRAGAQASGGAVLTWAVVAAAVVTLPFGPIASGARLLRPEALLAGAGLALLSAVIPWSLDQAALRRLRPRTLAVLVSLEPVAGALAGLIMLGEHLTWPQWASIACVTTASTGALTTGMTKYPCRADHR